jgi:hypothetical protein
MGTSVLMAAIAHLELFLLEKVAVVVWAASASQPQHPGALALVGRKTMSLCQMLWGLLLGASPLTVVELVLVLKIITITSLAGPLAVVVTAPSPLGLEETLRNPAPGRLAVALAACSPARHFITLALAASAGEQIYHKVHTAQVHLLA